MKDNEIILAVHIETKMGCLVARNLCFQEGKDGGRAPSFITFLLRIITTVSYTHLDVYKRQVK